MADDKIVRKDPKTGAYINEKGEAMKVTPKSLSFYSNNPSEPHDKSIHINKKDDGSYSVTQKSNGEKTESDINCFLTTACMRWYQEVFDDNCYELTTLRAFRDKYVPREDVELYYIVAPYVVEMINNLPYEEQGLMYSYIYQSIVKYCVKAIEEGDYDKAYQRYRASVLTLQDEFYDVEMEKPKTLAL